MIAGDPNRDGTVSKMEFRQNVRKLIDKQDVKEVDKLFDDLDSDKSGELDLAEIKSALKKLQDSARLAAERATGVMQQAQAMRQRADQIQSIADLTKSAEQASVDMAEVGRKSVGAQLGSILIKKGLKVSEIVTKWGGTKGCINKQDFRHEVNGLGLAASASDVDALFDSLDDDGGGTLDNAEVRTALKTLADECDQVKAAIKTLTAKSSELSKAARAAQSDFRRMKEEDERAKVELARKEEAKAQARAAAAAEAKAIKEAAAAEKKAALEREKAEFEAKIALKRTQSANKVSAPPRRDS